LLLTESVYCFCHHSWSVLCRSDKHSFVRRFLHVCL